jgi:cell division protein FtsI/penicillin-binding protein 2
VSIRARRIRLVAIVVTAGIVVAGFLDGFAQEPSAEGTVQAFLLAWQRHDYRAAASYTTGPAPAVSGALAGAFTQLDATAMFLSMGRVDQSGDTAEAHFSASVNLGEGGHQWTYPGQFALHRVGSGWKVQWAPSVINPRLGPGARLAVITQVPARGQVLDAKGQSLEVPAAVYEVGVWPRALADPAVTAQDFAQVTQLNASQVQGQIQAAPPGQFLTLLSLDPDSYAGLAPALARVPGLEVHRVSQRLFASEASEVVGTVGSENSGLLRDEGASYQPGTTVGLTGLQAAYQRVLAGSPTTKVVAENASGAEIAVLAQWPGNAGQPVRTTISSQVQAAALAALDAAPSAAAEIVAVQASTGKILAVAGRGAPGGRLPAGGALNAHLAPGTAFTIVSTAALLGSGFSTSTEIPCTSVANVGGQLFSDQQLASSLGANTPFSADFAQGCGTAFAGLSRRLTSSALATAVKGFGVGSKWQLPLPAFSGSVPAATTDGQLAGETIGQGVQVSPLGMALIAAEVDSGVWRSPVLVTKPSDGAASIKSPLTPGALTSLRALMREAVTSGSAKSANVSGAPVYGQTARVQTGSGRGAQWQSWFVGYRGDVAFTVLTSSQSSEVSASALAAQFLSALPAGGPRPG